MKGRDTCILSACNNKIPVVKNWATKETCSTECSKINKKNKVIERQARERGKETALCGVETCSNIFTVPRAGGTKCYWHRRGVAYHNNGSRLIYESATQKEGKIGKIHSAKAYHDFRSTTCKRREGLCLNYRECSDSLMIHKNGQFKYQINGGVDCWEQPRYNTYTTGCNCALAGVSSINIRG